jgi:hypothetical protein
LKMIELIYWYSFNIYGLFICLFIHLMSDNLI